MADHFHVWVRSGRTFLMQTRAYESRDTANSAAKRLRPHPADRMVRACSTCPASVRSKRRPPRWARIASHLAAALGADPALVRRALDDARREVQA